MIFSLSLSSSSAALMTKILFSNVNRNPSKMCWIQLKKAFGFNKIRIIHTFNAHLAAFSRKSRRLILEKSHFQTAKNLTTHNLPIFRLAENTQMKWLNICNLIYYYLYICVVYSTPKQNNKSEKKQQQISTGIFILLLI